MREKSLNLKTVRWIGTSGTATATRPVDQQELERGGSSKDLYKPG